MHQKIPLITARLLNSGCFNHLSDNEVSALHHSIMYTKSSASSNVLLHLIDYWHKADFSENDTSFALLQECNIVLQSIGMSLVENNVEEVYE